MSQNYVATLPPVGNKIGELESLRGLAALLIVMYHVPVWNEAFNINFLRNGYLMVELFFVLSGFVIFSAYSTKISTSKDLWRFQFLRLGRLYPVHLLFLLVMLMIEVAKYVAQLKMGISSPNTQPFRENNAAAFMEHLLLIQAIGPTGNETTFNGPAWSISVEFYTYLLFGLVLLNLPKWKTPIFALLFTGALTLIAAQYTMGFESVLRCFSGFFLGCIVADIHQRIQLRLPNIVTWIAAFLLIAFLAIKKNKDFDYLIFFLTAFLIFALVSSKGGLIHRMLSLKPLTWLGTISYSMYMCQLSVVWTANQVFRVVFKKPEIFINGRNTPALSLTEATIGYLSILAIVFTISIFVYNFIEKPMREKSRRFAFKQWP